MRDKSRRIVDKAIYLLHARFALWHYGVILPGRRLATLGKNDL